MLPLTMEVKMNKSSMEWILYVYTDKGWMEESRHDDEQDARHSLDEWRHEFPNCKFKIMEATE